MQRRLLDMRSAVRQRQAPATVMETATRLVQAFELQADCYEEDAPLWHGWAIHQAFLLGVEYAERREAEKRAA